MICRVVMRVAAVDHQILHPLRAYYLQGRTRERKEIPTIIQAGWRDGRLHDCCRGGDDGVESCMSICVSLCHTLPCIRRPLDDGVVPVSGVFLFNVLISECVRVSPTHLYSTLSCYVARRRPKACTVCCSLLGPFWVVFLSLVDFLSGNLLTGMETLFSFFLTELLLPLSFSPSVLCGCVYVLAGYRRGPAWLRNASRLDACVA